MKQEKISDIDKKLCLYFIFQNSIAFRDFWVPKAFHKPFYTYYYQYAPALSDELCWGGARGTGKSYDLEFKIAQQPFKSPTGEEHLLTSFRRSHIKDRMERVISLISLVPYLRKFLMGDTSRSLKSAVTRTPVYSVRFKNGTEIAAISVGEDPQAVLIQGRHPCLHANQRILLQGPKGLEARRLINRLKRGENFIVKSYDKKTKKIVCKKVIAGWRSPLADKKFFRVTLEGNSNAFLTNNHKCYVESDNECGFELKRVDELRIYKDKILTPEIKLNKAQISLFVGSLMGDAFCSSYPARKRKLKRKKKFSLMVKNKRRALDSVKFAHKAEHYEYVKFKFDVLKEICNSDRILSRTRVCFDGVVRKSSKFTTKTLYQLKILAELFYKSGKKKVTQEILDKIDEKALAIWFMDDGSGYKVNGNLHSITLNTQAFSKYEHFLMKRWFFEKFGLNVSIKHVKRDRKGPSEEKNFNYTLRFRRKKEALKFISLIIPYLHPIFAYKIQNKDTDMSLLGTKLNEFFIKENSLFARKVIKIIEENPYDTRSVYDIQVKDTHNFFAGDMLVSNCYRYIEEAGFYPQEAYMKFQNTQAPTGSKDCFYGIPNGRLDSPFFEMMHKLKKFKNKKFRIHRAMEPNWTQELKREKLSAFKTITSNEWLQEIEAQDGTPAYGYWSEADIRKNIDFTESTEYPGVIAKQLLTIAISAKDYEGLDPPQVLNRLPQIPDDCEVILGIDAGYSQPTVILPFYFYQKKWNLSCKILLTDRMISDDQTELIDYIASFYKAYLGIDTSSADGRDIASALCNPKNEEYANEQYDKRVFFIDFRAVVITGYKKIQKGSDPEQIEIEDIKEDLKMLTSKLLRDKFYNVEFNLLYDEDFIPEFLSETQKRIAHHEFTIYTPANVHIPEACRVFVGAWWFLHVKIEKPPLEDIEAEEEYGWEYPKYQETDFNLWGRGKQEKDENIM